VIGPAPSEPSWRGGAGARWLGARCLVALLLGAFSASGAVGCGGGAPLLHPAKPLSDGQISLGAGFAGHIVAEPSDSTAEAENVDRVAQSVDDLGFAPRLSPWVTGRIGLGGDNEAGLIYTGRAIRLDGRHVWGDGPFRLSLGAGASAVLPRPVEGIGSAHGGGADVPLLLGWSSASDLYSFWVGPRAGFELLTGEVAAAALDPAALDTAPALPVDLQSFFVGGVVGLRVGFRSVHVGAELGVAWRRTTGAFEGRSELDQTVDHVALAPGSALLLSF
jgi:hypothetical protein